MQLLNAECLWPCACANVYNRSSNVLFQPCSGTQSNDTGLWECERSPTLVKALRPELDTGAVRPRADSCECTHPDIIHSIGTKTLQQNTWPRSGHHHLRSIPPTVYILVQHRVLWNFSILLYQWDWFPCQFEIGGRGLLQNNIFWVSTWSIFWSGHLLDSLLSIAHFVSGRESEHIVSSLMDIQSCVTGFFRGELHNCKRKNVHAAKGESVP